MRKIKGYRIVKAKDCKECDFYKKIRPQKASTTIGIICGSLCQDCKRLYTSGVDIRQ
jgi:hypothetical protein